MNEFQIFKELTELDDDLLIQASREAQKKRTARMVLRVPLVAAIVILFAATAYAIKLTISVRYWDRPIERDGFSLTNTIGYGVGNEEGYYVAEVTYYLEPVTPQKVELLTDAMTSAWEQWEGSHEHFTGTYLLDEAGARLRYDGLAAVSAAFGLPLTGSAALEQTDGPCYVRLMIGDAEKAALEYADTGKVQPAALVLEDALQLEGSESGLTVFIALGSELPPSFDLRELRFLHQEGEPKHSQFRTESGVELVILQTGAEGETYNSCAVVWCENGIGYLADLHGSWDGGKAQDCLMPLLAELELP